MPEHVLPMMQASSLQLYFCENNSNKIEREVEICTNYLDATIYRDAWELEKNLHEFLAAETSRLKAQRQISRLFLDGGNLFARDKDAIVALHGALAAVELSEKLDFHRKKKTEEYLLKLSKSSVVEIGNAIDNMGGTVDVLDIGQRQAATTRFPNLWQELTDSINLKDKDLANYSEGLDRYNYLFTQVTNILSQLAGWVSADGDNHMKVQFKKIGQELQSLLDRYDPPGKDQVIAGASPTGGFKTEAEARFICEELGLDPALCIYPNRFGDKSYCVIPDLSQIKSMLKNLPGGGKTDDYKISIASYNTWKSGFDSQMSRLQDALQVRGQKYANTNSRFENYNKTISSIIQSMAEMLKSFLNF